MNKETQSKKIINELLVGNRVSSYWGFNNGIIRLTARIKDLRDAGHTIKDEWKLAPGGRKYKEYYL